MPRRRRAFSTRRCCRGRRRGCFTVWNWRRERRCQFGCAAIPPGC
jgi:hypothetical protein